MSVYIFVLRGFNFKFYKGMQNLYRVLCAFFNATTPMCRSPPRSFDFNSRFLGGFIMDKMPKRRKSKDNPYILTKDEANNFYLVSFKDSTNIYRSIRVTKEVYEELDNNEKDDLKPMNEYDRHIEHIPVDLYTMSIRALIKTNFEDEIISKINRERIINAIYKLPEPQNRRVYMYLVEELTNKEISEIENCDHAAISRSIASGIENLKINLKNF